jgi:hypothetical protein
MQEQARSASNRVVLEYVPAHVSRSSAAPSNDLNVRLRSLRSRLKNNSRCALRCVHAKAMQPISRPARYCPHQASRTSHPDSQRNSRTRCFEPSLACMHSCSRYHATKVAKAPAAHLRKRTKFFHSFGETFPQPLHVFGVRHQLSRRTDTNVPNNDKTAAN